MAAMAGGSVLPEHAAVANEWFDVLAPALHGYGSCFMVMFAPYRLVSQYRTALMARDLAVLPCYKEYHGHVPTWPADGQLNVLLSLLRNIFTRIT
jgi:hypothetical protein